MQIPERRLPAGVSARAPEWRHELTRHPEWRFRVSVRRQSLSSIEDRFSPGALLQRWWSCIVIVSFFQWTYSAVQWRERTALDIPLPRI